MRRRLAAIADIHGNSAALEAVLADIAALGVEEVLNLGDCLSGPLDPAGTARRLMALDLPTVRGNHDRWLAERRTGSSWEDVTAPLIDEETRVWLGGLPPCRVVDGVFLCHATPGDDLTYWLHRVAGEGVMRPATLEEAEAPAHGLTERLLLCGHTHLSRAVRLSDGRLVVNPGSVGCPGYADDTPLPHRVEAGVPHASYAVLEEGAQGWHVNFRLIPYDAAEMIARAKEQGFDDWVSLLSTGFLPPDRALP
ncbi:phosphodiesterase [Haematobacter massiliensis]|uniref:Metallophosphoesterase n=1 Tax=Haematobacter massiliensis TaxID=195105 RepID=A0A086YB06_9RHOB|nr:metallophosphoesterase family protein [Haematobacter massiliensis]KFI31456.1 metallophosphoesterase [Haematobacter massiliensis]OWJ71643.1 phosphodiesterase [Haematobacter massiliensis]OWJ88081.1 phosphodiesterase [Haematobacter massiliensis]QBJ23537.1 metallophosphoesterase [Haematobacter massiliensis]